MKIYKNLYIDKNVDCYEDILNKILDNIIIYDLYLICIDKNSQNLFEILECKEIFKKHNQNKKYLLVGLAYGKYNAFLLIKDIFKDYIKTKKDLKNIKSNFLKDK